MNIEIAKNKKQIFTKKSFLLFLVLSLGVLSPSFSENPEVAYIEEITILPDGSQQVVRYKPDERPMRIEAPPQPQKPRQRELLPHEEIELDRLEDDFEQGRITANEYYLRRNQILRSTYVDEPPNDNILEGGWRY